MKHPFSSSQAPEKPGSFVHASNVLALSVWFALAAGLIEAAVRWTGGILGLFGWKARPCWDTLHIVWAAIAVDAILFIPLALLLAAVAMLLPRWPWPAMATAIFAFLGFYGVLSVVEQLQRQSILILALGLSLVIGRWVHANKLAGMHFFRKSLLPLGVLSLAAILIVVVGEKLVERVQVSRLGQAPAGAPNVLLIVLDTLRADHIGAYGYERPTTPFLDQFSRKAVLFERAIASSSWSLASHVSLFTGRYQCEHKADLHNYDGRFATLAEQMARNGFVTAGFSANSLYTTCAAGVGIFHHYENVFSNVAEVSFRTTFGYRFAPRLFRKFEIVPEPFQAMPAENVRHRFLRWLDNRPDRPFFAFLNFSDVHAPYRPSPEFARRFRTNPRLPFPPEYNTMDTSPRVPGPELRQSIIDAYDAELAYLDEQLGLLFAELQRRNLDENLLVIITSDHGELLGEHNLYAHRKSLYLQEIRVPLLVSYPGRFPAGLRVGAPVGLVDIPATVARVTGLPAGQFPGTSLEAYWSPAPQEARPAFSELTGGAWPGVAQHWPIHQGWLKSLVTERWHFILQQDGKTELYDLQTDPEEQNNLSASPDHRGLVKQFTGRLFGLCATTRDP